MSPGIFDPDVFDLDVFGGEFAPPGVLTIDGTDLTATVQDKSPKVARKTLDVVLIDPSPEPTVGLDITWSLDLVTFIGTIAAVEARTFRSPDGTDHRFLKLTGTNDEPDVADDIGASGFGISDTPDDMATFAYKDLVFTTSLKDAVTEVRGHCQVFVGYFEAGSTVEVSSLADGYAAEVFTVLEASVAYPVWTGPVWDLDLGLGDYATATTGASDGGPLVPVTMPDYIDDKADDRIEEQVGGPDGTIYGAITQLVKGYSSINVGDSPCPAITGIDLATDQIALVWWRHEDAAGDVVISGASITAEHWRGFAWVTAASDGTFDVEPQTGDETSAIHVAVLPLGSAQATHDT